MAQFSFTPLVPKSPENVNTLNTILTQIQASLNSVDETQLAQATLQRLGLNNGSQIGRGKTNIAATESRTNVAYGTLTTPDQVSNVVLPADGLLMVAYQAVWQESVNGAARASLFMGANDIKRASGNGAPGVTETVLAGGVANIDNPLSSHPNGLTSGNYGAAYTGDGTTGQVVGALRTGSDDFGGVATIFAAAGTYTVSVQFRSTSGSITAKSRKLWVWTIGF